MFFNKFKESVQTRKWKALAEKAREQRRLVGFFHENYILNVEEKDYLFRFVIEGAPNMNPVSIQEVDALDILSDKNVPAPQLFYKDDDGEFLVEEVISGRLFENVSPPGEKISLWIMDEIIEFYKLIAAFQDDKIFDYLPEEWPRSGHPSEFFRVLSNKNQIIHRSVRLKNEARFEYLGIPENPYLLLQERAETLADRPFSFMHGDMHRGNLMLTADKKVIPIDWELAMYGDIMYCFSRSIHMGRYYDDEIQYYCNKYKQSMPSEFSKGFDDDLQFYMDYEALRSVITDTIRFPEVFKEERFSAKKEAELCLYYTDNLQKISKFLGSKTLTPDEAFIKFQEWGA